MAFFESKERREERLAEEARTEEQQREKEMMEREAEWETEKNDSLKSILFFSYKSCLYRINLHITLN